MSKQISDSVSKLDDPWKSFDGSLIGETQNLLKAVDTSNRSANFGGLIGHSHDQIGDISSSDDETAPETTYKDISTCLYYTATLSFFFSIVFGSCVVPNVDIIF